MLTEEDCFSLYQWKRLNNTDPCLFSTVILSRNSDLRALLFYFGFALELLAMDVR